MLTAASCDKTEYDSYTDADYARCAHVEYDGFLHKVCLDNPWPTELPPATQQGLSTFGCWINDTLAFVAGDPREPPRKEAYGTYYKSTWGGGVIIGTRNTYNAIDPRSLTLNLGLDLNSSPIIIIPSRTRFRFGSVDSYALDSIDSKVSINYDEASAIAYGTFNLTFYKPNTTDTLRLTDGRFDVLVNTF
jgi:hypothetical protein